MYYIYDQNSVIVSKSETIPEIENYGISDMDLDLTGYYEYTVSSVDSDHKILYYMQKIKPVSQLLYIIGNLQSENDILGQTSAQLQLDNMQLNATVDTLGAMAAQSQLDIMGLKGGAS
ncbi:hypothetical protein ACRQU7_15775 [Caproiciproducens sp. R1]|uniref:hypothetical protein n=1 Tax=Caproiciproducens sp. R1 TaxID=3435000 RepID=UPI0040336C4E